MIIIRKKNNLILYIDVVLVSIIIVLLLIMFFPKTIFSVNNNVETSGNIIFSERNPITIFNANGDGYTIVIKDDYNNNLQTGLKVNDKIYFITIPASQLHGTTRPGTLPIGLTENTWYYISSVNGSLFKISRTINGNPIDVSGSYSKGVLTYV